MLVDECARKCAPRRWCDKNPAQLSGQLESDNDYQPDAAGPDSECLVRFVLEGKQPVNAGGSITRSVRHKMRPETIFFHLLRRLPLKLPTAFHPSGFSENPRISVDA